MINSTHSTHYFAYSIQSSRTIFIFFIYFSVKKMFFSFDFCKKTVFNVYYVLRKGFNSLIYSGLIQYTFKYTFIFFVIVSTY